MKQRIKRIIRAVLPDFVLNFLLPYYRKVRLLTLWIEVQIKYMLNMPLKAKHTKAYFEIHIVEHCNLNCKSCNNFSCIAEPEFIDVEEFRRDFARMGELFSHECDRIYLLGGEPLLHPQINQIVSTARECFTDGNIYVFTNGILLAGMSDDFWQTCHNSKAGILISAYPITIDMEKINSQACKFDVDCRYAWGQNKGERNKFSISPINLKGNSNISLNFYMCGSGNNCIVLSHGRLYTCVFAAHVHHFNKRFGTDIKITDADSVNIYDDLTADEIMTKMIQPIPACRYCSRNKPPRLFEWGITNKEITEWL